VWSTCSTDLGVFERQGREAPFALIEMAPGVTQQEIKEKTDGSLVANH
jgi:acyl CoA:acetate/3-ketoacid CoA transferase beta subunit